MSEKGKSTQRASVANTGSVFCNQNQHRPRPVTDEATMYHLQYNALPARVGNEMMDQHRVALVSLSGWAQYLETVAFVPITSATSKDWPDDKPNYLAVPIRKDVAGQTKNSLLLPCSLDTLLVSELSTLLEETETNRSKHTLPRPHLEYVRLNLSQLLVCQNGPHTRNKHNVGNHLLATGDVILMKEFHMGGKKTIIATPM